MVVLNKIYTRSGDDGTTALGTGERVRKNGARVTAYGTVDEANATIGVALAALAQDDREVREILTRVQNDLFDLGADLCVPDREQDRRQDQDYEPLRISNAQVDRLEGDIDRLNGELEPLKSFILPGGSVAAAALHQARTVTRRAERMVIELAAKDDEPVSEAVIKYLNRLSDLLFVAARFVSDRGKADVLWVPGQNRR